MRILALVVLLIASGKSRAVEKDLEARLTPLVKAHKGKVALAVKNLRTGEEFYLNADERMPTASLIKLPIMVELFWQADEGKVKLDTTLTLKKEDKVPGSGILTAHFSDGATFPLRDAMRLMIVFSDNTATNLVLDQIGIPATNVRMEKLGLKNTRVNAKVFRGSTTSIDPGATKKYGLGSTTAREMVQLLELMETGKVASPVACQEMIGHLKACDDKEKMTRFLPAGTIVAHKTGSVNASKTDAGILYLKTGPVALCVLTDENDDRRWVADNAAQVLIAKIAREVCDHFGGPEKKAKKQWLGEEGISGQNGRKPIARGVSAWYRFPHNPGVRLRRLDRDRPSQSTTDCSDSRAHSHRYYCSPLRGSTRDSPMAKKQLRVGMIGYGFMGRAHSNAYKQVGQFFPSNHEVVLKAACARNADQIKAFADQWGYESTETDWRKLVERKDIDVIDICTPNNLHKEIALAAAASKKAILCEKPLAMNAVEGREMVAAVERAGVPNMVWYNYRRIPAVSLAKKLVDEGRLGKIFHYRAKFLQDWTIKADLPQGGQGLWRLDVAAAGSGVSGDLLAHCIDTAIWMNGRIESITALTETFVKERMHNLTGKVEKVGIDDACIFMGRFANGSLANFESTRYARGHKALYTFEINGENMSLFWDLHDLHRLQVFDYKDDSKIRGWKSVHVTDNSPDHPYMANWWVPGLAIGYDSSFTHQVADFIQGLESGTPQGPTFKDALETQCVLDAILDSAKSHEWVNVAK